MDEMIAQAPAKFENNSRRHKNLVSNCPANTHHVACYSKCVLWNGEFARNEDSPAPTQIYWRESVFLIRSAGESHEHPVWEVSLFTSWLVIFCRGPQAGMSFLNTSGSRDVDTEVSVCLGVWSTLLSSEVPQSVEEDRSEA